jgi:hypothetical protein
VKRNELGAFNSSLVFQGALARGQIASAQWLQQKHSTHYGGFMRYVDGYVLPVPKKNLQAYRRMAQR